MTLNSTVKRYWPIFLGVAIGQFLAHGVLSPYIKSHKKDKEEPKQAQEAVMYDPINLSEFDSQYERDKLVVMTSHFGNLQKLSMEPIHSNDRLYFELNYDGDSALAYFPVTCGIAYELQKAMEDNISNQIKVEGKMSLCTILNGDLIKHPGTYMCLRAEHVQIGPTVYDVMRCGE